MEKEAKAYGLITIEGASTPETLSYFLELFNKRYFLQENLVSTIELLDYNDKYASGSEPTEENFEKLSNGSYRYTDNFFGEGFWDVKSIMTVGIIAPSDGIRFGDLKDIIFGETIKVEYDSVEIDGFSNRIHEMKIEVYHEFTDNGEKSYNYKHEEEVKPNRRQVSTVNTPENYDRIVPEYDKNYEKVFFMRDDEDSSSLLYRLGIERDHPFITKFSSEEDFYLDLNERLKKLYEEEEHLPIVTLSEIEKVLEVYTSIVLQGNLRETIAKGFVSW